MCNKIHLHLSHILKFLFLNFYLVELIMYGLHYSMLYFITRLLLTSTTESFDINIHVLCYCITDQAVDPVRLSPSVVFFSVPDKLTLEVVASGAHDGISWTLDAVDISISQLVYFYEIYFKEPTTNDDYGEYNVFYSGQAGTGATILAIPLG